MKKQIKEEEYKRDWFDIILDNWRIITFFILLLLFYIFVFYPATHKDCNKNPPMIMYCSSNNLIDNGLRNCIKIRGEKHHFLSSDDAKLYSCIDENNRTIELEYSETKCSLAVSNSTEDWNFCKK